MFLKNKAAFFPLLLLLILATLLFSISNIQNRPSNEQDCVTGVKLTSKHETQSDFETKPSTMHTNVFGEKLIPCCYEPMTGYFRDGFCRTDDFDRGRHVVCAVMTEEFLEFTKAMGNDLSTPRPEYRFPGLKPGDKWCLCALRWKEAHEHGKAPLVVLEACAEEALKYVELSTLVKYAYKVKQD